MRSYFEKYGAITDCVIMRDRHTGHPRGFGFVTYADETVAAKVASQRHDLDGRQVEAKRAVPRNECAQPAFTPKASMFPRYPSDAGGGSSYPTSGGDGGGGGYGGTAGSGYGRVGSSAGYGAVPTAVVSGVRGGAMHDRGSGGGGGGGGRHGSPNTSMHVGGSRKIFVGGLPSACHNEEFRAYFSRFGTIVEAQVMFDHQTGNSRGFGFVTYADEAGVAAAVGVGRMHEIMDKNVEVKRAETKSAAERRAATSRHSGSGGGGNMGGGGSSGTRDNGYGTAGRDMYGGGGRGDGYGGAAGAAYGGAVMGGATAGGYSGGAYAGSGGYANAGTGGGYGMTPEQYYYQAQAAAAAQTPQGQQVMTPAQMASWQQYYAALGYQYAPGYNQPGAAAVSSPTSSGGGPQPAYDPYYSGYYPAGAMTPGVPGAGAVAGGPGGLSRPGAGPAKTASAAIPSRNLQDPRRQPGRSSVPAAGGEAGPATTAGPAEERKAPAPAGAVVAAPATPAAPAAVGAADGTAAATAPVEGAPDTSAPADATATAVARGAGGEADKAAGGGGGGGSGGGGGGAADGSEAGGRDAAAAAAAGNNGNGGRRQLRGERYHPYGR
ncbi:hypothetical protein BU14_0337s0010 [Porphyra umbilicalis]|uniref:RRM domain-containing protein n=1 Tax=Porphyra umbilicalis TaxID=2786 RepID=A0A1X6NYF8_PORUM|nr:hypothetical protein BU14_0337s0010 [Porphyra umbilicalis]|eukprot:OSX73575.1 hypothetical protein BU14_0337s0010 [Porphyra umbilicalis]